jgi:hypothetical protein
MQLGIVMVACLKNLRVSQKLAVGFGAIVLIVAASSVF